MSRRAARLPRFLEPRSAEIRLELDPARGKAFRGEVTHQLELARPTRKLPIHAFEIEVSGVRALAGGNVQRAEVEDRPRDEMRILHFAKPLPAGPVKLRLGFRGRLRGDLRGLYFAEAGGHRYALSQLAATHARRVFPCFDEPDRKARFQLSVTTGEGHQVLSNQPALGSEAAGRGRRTHHFAATPPLPTYLLALAVGAFEGSKVARCGATPIRIWSVPGKRRLQRFALEAASESLARLERWFALPHPYAKCDLVAVPDFELGAMENAGAVFFRENLLLLDPRRATPGERRRAAEVIAHELSHMWFGNLVTMAWWDDLWLNETFATWMAYQIVDDWKPEWAMWRDFQHGRAAALDEDALRDTHPVYVDVASPEEATENFDLITYDKGASVIRMTERWLGAKTFRAGVRRYIREHAEGNAVSGDLWRALEVAARREVSPVVRAWIERPGHPLVSVARSRGGIALSQQPFSLDPKRESDAGPWPVPWVGRAGSARGRGRRIETLLEKRRAHVKLGGPEPAFVYGNADEGGFFRVRHESEELARLARWRSKLAPVERMGLVGHEWALVRAGLVPLARLLDLAIAFGDEQDPDVLATLREPLHFVSERIAPAAGDGALAAWQARVAAAYGPSAEAAGWRPARGESDDARTARATRLRLLAEAAAHAPSIEGAAQRIGRLLGGANIDPEIRAAIVEIAPRVGDAALFDAYHRAWRGAATPQEGRRFLHALPRFTRAPLVARALRLSLDRRLPNGEVAVLLAGALRNPAAREAAWDFARANWARLSERMGAMLTVHFLDETTQLGTRRARREVAAFFREHPIPSGRRALRMALERFDLEHALVRRAAPELRRWLDG